MRFNVRVQRCYYNEKFKECVLTREPCFKLGAVCEYCEVAKDRPKSLTESESVIVNKQADAVKSRWEGSYPEKPICPIKHERCYDNGWCELCDDPKVKIIEKREKARKIEEARIDEYNASLAECHKRIYESDIVQSIEQKRKESIFQKIKRVILG